MSAMASIKLPGTLHEHERNRKSRREAEELAIAKKHKLQRGGVRGSLVVKPIGRFIMIDGWVPAYATPIGLLALAQMTTEFDRLVDRRLETYIGGTICGLDGRAANFDIDAGKGEILQCVDVESVMRCLLQGLVVWNRPGFHDPDRNERVNNVLRTLQSSKGEDAPFRLQFVAERLGL